MLLQNKDQFGFYQVGNNKVYSKLEAIEMHTKTGVHPHWDFNESVYSTMDWTKEPAESLSEIYRRRAQQIRDHYDYLVLMYSSGADCDNILHTFLDNDIKLEEVASFVNYDATKDKQDHWFNREVFEIAIPKIDQYKTMQPDLKHRIIDICKPIIDYFSTDESKFNWVYSMNSIYNPNSTLRNHSRSIVPEWKNMINAGKRVGLIWGIDKPRLYIEDNRYCFRFIDVFDSAVNPQQQRDNIEGHFDEFFYWTPDMPEIVVKQAHVVKNYLTSATKYSNFMVSSNSGLGYKIIDGKKYSISSTGVNALVYPKYEYHFANNTKPVAIFWTGRDRWFFDLNDNHIAKKSWKMGLDHLWNSAPDYWKNDPTDPTKALKQCLSKSYFLE